MRKKSYFVFCTVVIVVSNFLMAVVINDGEEIGSNIFAILVALFLIPGFLWAINNGKISLIRAESCALLMLAIISVMRLINRIDTLPLMVNSAATIVALGTGVVLIVVTIVRLIKKYK